ncbi:MAG: YkgJ family cysteine cluster protein [Desulfobulbaceae bacterium]|nr:YkgJ family cysteine cluster protein [Desulfobulbaceae bacterium]
MDHDQLVPPDRTLIDRKDFNFHCHSGVRCFLSCCRNVDMLLFPYDILRLKQKLKLQSSDFVHKYTMVCEGSHLHFPGLKLRLTEDTLPVCPFLAPHGCTVYEDRPSACRTYPLERGVEHVGPGQPLKIHYFMTHHAYCMGHDEVRTYTLRQWERDQKLHDYNLFNDLWAELDAFFSTNPWAGEGKAGPYQQLAFMVCYNIDGFRAYVERHGLLNTFRLNKDERRRISNCDEQLLRFGFSWLEFILGGRKNLIPK